MSAAADRKETKTSKDAASSGHKRTVSVVPKEQKGGEQKKSRASTPVDEEDDRRRSKSRIDVNGTHDPIVKLSKEGDAGNMQNHAPITCYEYYYKRHSLS